MVEHDPYTSVFSPISKFVSIATTPFELRSVGLFVDLYVLRTRIPNSESVVVVVVVLVVVWVPQIGWLHAK